MCVFSWRCGGGACILKGLVQHVRGPFRLLSSQTKLWWRGSLQQDMAAGGERAAAAALQTYSPAGGGYLSHLVHSSGWPIPSTTTTTTTTAATHGEGHIWPYLSMCAAVWQHTLVEPQKATFNGECKKIRKLPALKCEHWQDGLETRHYRVRNWYWTIAGLIKSVIEHAEQNCTLIYFCAWNKIAQEIHILLQCWIKRKRLLSITRKWKAGFIWVCICNVIVGTFIHAGKVVSSPLAFIYMVVFRLLNRRA